MSVAGDDVHTVCRTGRGTWIEKGQLAVVHAVVVSAVFAGFISGRRPPSGQHPFHAPVSPAYRIVERRHAFFHDGVYHMGTFAAFHRFPEVVAAFVLDDIHERDVLIEEEHRTALPGPYPGLEPEFLHVGNVLKQGFSGGFNRQGDEIGPLVGKLFEEIQGRAGDLELHFNLQVRAGGDARQDIQAAPGGA